jgi:hypothetical protein
LSTEEGVKWRNNQRTITIMENPNKPPMIGERTTKIRVLVQPAAMMDENPDRAMAAPA